MMNRYVVVAVLFTAAICAPSSAVEPLPQERAKVDLVDPTLTEAIRAAAPQLTFTTSDDNKTARVQYGSDASEAKWFFAVAGPVAKNKPSTVLVTDDGLKNAVTLEFGVHREWWRQTIPPEEFRALCRKLANADECDRKSLPSEDAKQEFDHAGHWGSVLLYGISAKYGRESFDFADAATLADRSETHNGSSVKAAIGRIFDGGPVYYAGLSYRHDLAYAAADSATICTPVGTAGTVCRDSALGAPTRRANRVWQAEARKFLGAEGLYGLSPRVSYSPALRGWSVEVPLYARSAKGTFNGGVNAAWDSKTHKPSLSLFVGALPALLGK